MNKYEAMFIVRPDFSEEEKKAFSNSISEAITKNNGAVADLTPWSEKRKLYFPLKKYREGVYYLMHFSAASSAITPIKHAYKLNENILRVLITKAS